MKADFKAKLIVALRSGKYEQDAGRYHRLRTVKQDGTHCFCVMGVVADVLNPDGWEIPEPSSAYHQHCLFVTGGKLAAACLRRSDLLTIGMTDAEQWDDFIKPNDEDGVTFAEFADRLEKAA